jgi:diaminopimelate decarboxylase
MNRSDHVREVINRYQSSFYMYDLDDFKIHLENIKNILHPKVKIWYATKANPLSEILRLLLENGFGADVASLGELQAARLAGHGNPGTKNLIATGPAKTKNYLATLMQAEVRLIVIESLNQLKDLNEVAGKLGRKQDVLLRVQLDWANEDKSILGGNAITPFGLGIEDWQSVNISHYKHINVLGLHCFQWGNILEVSQLEKIWVKTIESCQRLSLEMNFPLEILDLGGGLGISYGNGDEIEFSDVHEVLLRLKKTYCLNEIWLELGRYCMGKFGSYFTKIIDIKTVRGKNIIVTEGGINHMARPALVGESFPCHAFENSDPETKNFSIHGPLCTALDFLGNFELPSSLKVGDWLEFKRTGAYGFTESMPYFLCHNLAGEAFILNQELIVPRVPRTHLDWMV